tara:strand:+ start:440 stop:2833 length:2394 start_codon:yes stop_codon:yes gene_type:complete
MGYAGFKVFDAPTTSGGGAHEIISKLTSRNGKSIFMNLEPAAMALLIPKIRLYKQVFDGKKLVAEPEFIFEDFYSKSGVMSIFEGAARTIGGKGLSEASWALKGTNPAEAEKVINVNLKFEFQSAADLLGDRYDTNNGSPILSFNNVQDDKANMIDLILHPPGKKDAKDSSDPLNSYKPAFYKIKMVVGWARPHLQNNRLPGLSPMETRDLLAELSSQRMAMVLNLVSHEFDIQENGQIALGVEYIGSMLESINGNAADILRVQDKMSQDSGGAAVEQEMSKNEREISDLEEYVECLKIKQSIGENEAFAEEIADREDDLKGLEEERSEIQEEIDEISAEIKGEVYQQFLSSLEDDIMEIEVDEDDIEEWVETLKSTVRPEFSQIAEAPEPGAPDNAEEGVEQIETNQEEQADADSENKGEAAGEAAEKASGLAQDASKGYIHYLALGSILEKAVASGMGVKNLEVSNSIIITGPIVIHHPRGGLYQFNLADLPVPFQDFQAWFFETVVRKQLATYPLKQFLKEILEKLVKKVLQPSECFPKGREKRVVSIAMTNFTISEETAQAAQMDPVLKLVPLPIPRSNTDSTSLPPLPLDNGEAKNDVNCLIFYMNNYKASDLLANADEDKNKGIYHFFIGAEGGLIKSIDFTRTDVQGMREARSAESRNLGQIRDVYDAKVTMFGNQMFYPGMKVFLNPPLGFGHPAEDGGPDGAIEGTGGSLSNLLGIGGYYDVITVESTITQSGQYETVLDCKFAQSGGINDSVDAKCNSVLASPPEEQKGLIGSAIGAAADFVFGSDE